MQVTTFPEFLALVDSCGVSYSFPYRRARYRETLPAQKPEDNQIEVSWTSGGLSGGSCWGTAADQPVRAEAEPDLEDLDKLLEALKPDLTFLQYKALVKELVLTTEHTETEYYGNYYEKKTKSVNLKSLYEYFRKQGWIND